MGAQDEFFEKANRLMSERLYTMDILSFIALLAMSLLILWLLYIIATSKILELFFKIKPKMEKKLDKNNRIYHTIIVIGWILSAIYSYYLFNFWFL